MTDAKPPRLDSVDLLRGIAMVVMALDHVRDYFHEARFDPLDLSQSTTFLFLTRWVTHHCAPAFVFLAGTGAFLSLGRGKTRAELARFLVTRGLWLVFLELTVVRFGWTFNVDYVLIVAQVIWVLGWSMVALAALIYLPRIVLAIVALGMIALHNLTDGIDPHSLGSFDIIWRFLHVQSGVAFAPGHIFLIIYPLIPWIGVMAAGYLFGEILRWEERERRKTLYVLGFSMIAAFVVLRAINVYGDPHPWSVQQNTVFTMLSFINTTKYPPSLLYLLMTLGPAIVALPLFERWKGWSAQFFILYGRVPLFYYVIHIPLIHLAAVIAAVLTGHDPSFLFASNLFAADRGTYGFSLWVVYGIWVGIVLVLYYPCRWFADVKRRRRDVWLSYL